MLINTQGEILRKQNYPFSNFCTNFSLSNNYKKQLSSTKYSKMLSILALEYLQNLKQKSQRLSLKEGDPFSRDKSSVLEEDLFI